MRVRHLLAAAAIFSGIAVFAQAPTASPTFEAATIKPSDPASQGQYIRRQPGGRFSTTNMPVRELVRFAYNVQDFQLDGIPAWASSERYDIIAKAEGDPPPMPPGSEADPMILMFRALLADRFQLKVHRDTREQPVYALTRARADRLGPRLEPSTLDCQAIITAAQAVARAGGPPPQPPPPDASGRPSCGIRGGFGMLAGNGFPIAQLVNTLAQVVRRTVVDRTGLTGAWAFDLKFAMDPNQLPGPLPPGVQLPPVDPDSPSIFTAVEEQLGLRLESTRGPVDMVIVDRLERPTPD
jgi:bla regulator protein blaR1